MAIARAHSAAGSSLRVTIVLAAAALMLTASPRATSHSTDERSTRFELTAHGSISLPVMLNGRGPYRMLLDTGSTHSVISSSIARSLAAPVVSRTVIVTPTGEATRLVVRIAEWSVGPVAVTNVLPSIADRGVFDGDADGLIGQDVLGDVRYTIDFRQTRIRWSDDCAKSEAAFELSLVSNDGRPVVALEQQGSTLRLVADSGASGLVLFNRRGNPVESMIERRGKTRLTTLLGAWTAMQVVVRQLRVGRYVVTDLPAVVVSGETGDAVDGLLPLRLFDRVTFDPRARLLTVLPPS